MTSSGSTKERIQAVYLFLQEKQRRLEALISLFVSNPNLPIEIMVREYSTVLDKTDGGIYREKARRDVITPGLTPGQMRARKQRNDTRQRAISVAMGLICTDTSNKRGRSAIERVAALMSCNPTTLYNYFSSSEELLWAAYGELIRPYLKSNGE